MFNTNTNNKNDLITCGVLRFRFKEKDVMLKKYAFLGNKKQPEIFIDTEAAKRQNINIKKIKSSKVFAHYQSGGYFDVGQKFIKLEFFIHFLISKKEGNDFLIKLIVAKIDVQLKLLKDGFPNFINASFLSINNEGKLKFTNKGVISKLQATDNFLRCEKDRKLYELKYSNNYDVLKNTHESNINFPFNPSFVFSSYWSQKEPILISSDINKNNYINLLTLFPNDPQLKKKIDHHLNNKNLILAYNSVSKTDLKTKMVINNNYIKLTLGLHILLKKKKFFYKQVSLLRLYHNIIALNEKIKEIA